MPTNRRLSLALAPLDERPVNTRYPQMLGAIAGVDVLLPAEEVLGSGRTPADVDAIGKWLYDAAHKPGLEAVDGVIASAEYLTFGNLVNSRVSHEAVTDVLPRLKVLENISALDKPVYAFGLITRVSNADGNVEEPFYWKEYGTRFYQYSGLLHKREERALDAADHESLARLERELPANLIGDWLQRRLRNHTVNLALIELLARERLSFLLLTSDDTSPWGTPSREKKWLESWLSLMGPTVQGRLLVHPGADEVGSALVTRMICQHRGVRPTVYPLYAVPGGEKVIAPYEDRPVKLTVEGQIKACGCLLTDSPDDADIILGVLPPSPVRTEFRQDFTATERRDRQGHFIAFFTQLGGWQRTGRTVALADVSYPNGADPIAMEILLSLSSPLAPGKLAAYGAWNTAGNTLGTVVAQAVCSRFIEDQTDRQLAQHIFLTHRFLEDYGYQALVRAEVRKLNQSRFGKSDPDPQNSSEIAQTCQNIEEGLNRVLTEELQRFGVGTGLRIALGSVRLPWRRTFEVDFDLIP
ncbi:MAG: DUF4127 family protein [Armatimonadaceae bacterium]